MERQGLVAAQELLMDHDEWEHDEAGGLSFYSM
jgi:hypothetical protein